ncbi:MAG: transposase domain-containing protein, partial [Oligoflexales bacterium]
NAIRPFVVGRKSWLFSGSPRGAHASATIYSCLETAKCNGLDPYQWLSHVLETLPLRSSQDNIDDLLPLNI